MSSITNIGDWFFGVIDQVANTVTGAIPAPVGSLPNVPAGDVLEPIGAAGRSGANLVAGIVDLITGHTRSDAQAQRTARPLLAESSVSSPGGGAVTRYRFNANLPDGDWAVVGKEGAMVAIYVDGRYVSSTVVIRERTGGYSVNLGALPAGAHSVEIRLARDVAGSQAPVPTISRAWAETVTGEQALIERHAPILEMRQSPRRLGEINALHSDAPLMLVPQVTKNADGSKTILYSAMYSNEDGGTKISGLWASYTRGTDYEPIYRVQVAADGRVIAEQFQSPLHQWLPFDGVREGQRPVLRLSTANNLLSARIAGKGAERWGDASSAPPPADQSSSTDIMLSNPWMFAIMGKELLREGKAAPAGQAPVNGQIQDIRQYVYLRDMPPSMQAAIQARGGVDLLLADGRTIRAQSTLSTATAERRFASFTLPKGVNPDTVRGVQLLGAHAFVFNSEYQMRNLEAATSAAHPVRGKRRSSGARSRVPAPTRPS